MQRRLIFYTFLRYYCWYLVTIRPWGTDVGGCFYHMSVTCYCW